MLQLFVSENFWEFRRFVQRPGFLDNFRKLTQQFWLSIASWFLPACAAKEELGLGLLDDDVSSPTTCSAVRLVAGDLCNAPHLKAS